MSQYPEDEFDVAGRDRGPQGVHREPPSLLRALAPFIAVIVIVPLLAWGAVSLLAGGGSAPQAEPTPAATTATTAPPTDEPSSPETTTEPADGETSPEPQTSEPADTEDVVLTTSISVLNGAGIGGLAGDVAGVLQEGGFTTVGAADYAADAPDVTTLYYRNAELAPTAEAIGELVDIDNLVEAPSATENVEIAIVLRPDYTAR